MEIFFLTGNKDKLEELQIFVPEIKGLDIDLPEIQEIDAHAVIVAKLEEAMKHNKGKLIVEDTSLYIDGLNGLPGPLVKWFLKTIGAEGIFKMAASFENMNAYARTTIGYSDENGEIQFFEGTIRGTVVSPRGDKGFGWDPIFQPEGCDKTYAEMNADEKNDISMRKIAAAKLRNFLS